MPTQHNFELRLLGLPALHRDGQPIDRLESRKAYGVLYYLCCQANGVSRAELAGLFWPDKPESRGRGNLSRVLHSINRQLPGLLTSDRHRVQLPPAAPLRLDTRQFEELASSRQPAQIQAALALVRGGFLEDFRVRGCPEFEIWLDGEREKWLLRTTELLQAMAAHHTQRGEYRDGLGYVETLLALAPWQEEAHQQKMRLLFLLGRRAAALAQFEQCQRILSEELGALPNRETLQLRRQIEAAAMPPGPASAPRLAPGPPLIDRGQEHTRLAEQWQAARQGRGLFTLLAGPAGVGKSALADAGLAFAAGDGARVLRGRCVRYRSDLPYQAFIEALRPLLAPESGLLNRIDIADTWYVELSRLWPTIHAQRDGLHPSLNPEPAARHRLFEAIAQLLEACTATEGSLALFLDDLHEADQETLDLLRYLFHRLRHLPLWFLAALRPEEAPPGHALTVWRNVLLREQLTETVALAPLDADGISRLLAHAQEPAGGAVGGLPPQEREQLIRFLWRWGKGNPFVVTQLLHALAGGGLLAQGGDGWRLDSARLAALEETPPLPDGVAALMENRLARLNPRARRLLQVAAVIGSSFSLQALQTVSSEPVEWVEACLSNWMGRALVLEEGSAGESRYRFSQPMLWRVVLGGLSAGQQQRLRQRIRTVEAGGADPSRVRRRGSAVIEEILPPGMLENPPEERDIW